MVFSRVCLTHKYMVIKSISVISEITISVDL